MKTLSYATTMTRCNPSAGGKPSITPYTRPVIHTVNGQPKESEFEKVRVVSYNVLAQCYCRSSIFHWSDRGDIRWKRRKGKITKEIEEYNADLLLLQELDNFSDYHRGALRKLGYDGYTYVQRNSRKDGVGIFWKSEDFEVVSETPVHFNAIAEQSYGIDYAQKKNNPEYLLRDSVGAITVLRSNKHPSDVGIILATCHLFWNPDNADVKLLQAFHMVERIRQVVREHDYPLILGMGHQQTGASA
uniref:Endonuclease/exonuclease/phosphatase domain-containing protein n=1 Tax=Rhodosorus marinus TaxID=101924 RepID=A0A7S2ZGJ1_9RHOD|mmetsp:Transcript_17341/g.70350  ORF Transcript_17341/g.70350 Transcript_17341/m.70350 type:complete len:245 (+) Transcript_17341:110-844(+)